MIISDCEPGPLTLDFLAGIIRGPDSSYEIVTTPSAPHLDSIILDFATGSIREPEGRCFRVHLRLPHLYPVEMDSVAYTKGSKGKLDSVAHSYCKYQFMGIKSTKWHDI